MDFEDKVIPFAYEKGAASIGTIGTCWGSYMVVRQSSNAAIKAGVSVHPSHSTISDMLKENEEDLLTSITCPQLFMPAGNFLLSVLLQHNKEAQHLSPLVVFSESVFGMWNKLRHCLHSRTHARTHGRTHALRTHARTHTRTDTRLIDCTNYTGGRKHCFYIALFGYPTLGTIFSGCRGVQMKRNVPMES